MPIDNVHDKFFRESFSIKNLVVGSIEDLFPKELSQHIDLVLILITTNEHLTKQKIIDIF